MLINHKLRSTWHPGGHSIVKNTRGWLNKLGSGIDGGERYFGVLQNILIWTIVRG